MNDELNDLKARREAIEGGAVKANRQGSLGKVALGAGLMALLGSGAYLGVTYLVPNRAPTPDVPVSGTVDFPEDVSASDSLALPRIPDPIVIDRPVVRTEVDSATLARLKDLEDELDAARALAADRENETEEQRRLREELEREREQFTKELAALKSAAENDQERARQFEEQMTKRLSSVIDQMEAAEAKAATVLLNAQNKATTDLQNARSKAARLATEREEEFKRQLDAARSIDPLEEERLRLEAEALRLEQARLEELEKTRAARLAAEKARINSSMVAISNSSAEEAGAAEGRELSANEAFVRRAAEPVKLARASRITNPEATVPQGALIQASLETAIDSTLPGPIRAVVAEDVHSLDGSAILIPAGSKVFGEYSAGIALGQRRILIVWTRVLTPDNRSISIASYGGDRLGRSGTTGKVDTRFGTKFAGAAAISIVGAVPAILAGRTGSAETSNTLQDVGEDLNDVTSTAIGGYLTIPPTIYVKQGALVTIVLDRDVEIL